MPSSTDGIRQILRYGLHELGHLIYSDHDPWDWAVQNHGRYLGGVINGLEDVQIEQVMIGSGMDQSLFEAAFNATLKDGYLKPDDRLTCSGIFRPNAFRDNGSFNLRSRYEESTGVRDYIHVDDLASGHLAALDYVRQHAGVLTVNLGTGKGISVFQLIHDFERASGVRIPYELVPRRMGDLPEYYAQADFALAVLGWKAEHGIDRMCQDSWRWQNQNPKGFAD